MSYTIRKIFKLETAVPVSHKLHKLEYLSNSTGSMKFARTIACTKDAKNIRIINNQTNRKPYGLVVPRCLVSESPLLQVHEDKNRRRSTMCQLGQGKKQIFKAVWCVFNL